MTRIWIDAEFNEYERRHELISMALVAEDGREWYEVLRCDQPGPWVAENVMPKLGKAPILPGVFADSLEEFLAHYTAVHIIGDYPSDIALFCDSLIVGPGVRIDTPTLTLEVIRLDGESADPHNALADARGIRDIHLASEATPLSSHRKPEEALAEQQAQAEAPEHPHWRRLTGLWRYGVNVLPPSDHDFYIWLAVLDTAIDERANRTRLAI